ncbi:MAG: rod shape-determining protein MreD [Clostridia bacterium]|nr:rod shape-determining protein MreD [Clostridia bacterium]
MKLKVISISIYIFILALIQSTVLEYARIFHVKPNLLIVFVISYAFIRGSLEGAVVGFFAGLVQDIASGKVLGLYTLLGLYLGLAMGSVNKRLYRENVFLVVFFTFIASFVYETVVYLLIALTSGKFDIVFPLRSIILPEALYNSIVSILIFILVVKLHYWYQRKENLPRKY